jgi:CheY-like chemotaxis protein
LGRTILVADDSPTIQKKASGILTGEGLDVVTVSNGVAAVKKLPTVNPIVVLADVSMPGKDGYEVCEYIKSNASLSNIFVLLIFSDTDPYEEAKGARVSADGRIKKPFDREELVATVAKFVNQAEAARPVAAPPPPPPPPAFEVEPIEEEQPTQASPAPDLAAFSGGVAFGVPPGEEMPAIPPEPMMPQPLPAEPKVVPEEPVPAHDAALGAIAESAMLVNEPEPALVSEPEVATPAPEMVVEHEAEAEPAPQAAEPLLVEEEPAPSPEQSAERTMMFRAPADIAQPILRDELEPAGAVAEAAEPPAAEAAEAPAVEPPPPVESAEPELVSERAAEMVSEPAVAEAPVTEAAEPPPVAEPAAEPETSSAAEAAPVETPAHEETPDITPPEGTPIASMTLESYTLSEAVAGQVRFAAPQAEPPLEAPPEAAPHEPEATAAAPEPEIAAPEPEAAAPEAAIPVPGGEAAAETPEAPPEAAAEPAAPAVAALDPEQVFSIIHKVVVKMSPPALSPQMIEDIARRFTDEILAELRSES